MAAIITNNFKVSAASKFVSQVGTTGNKLYIFMGRSTPWANDLLPTVPSDNIQSQIDSIKELLYAKIVESNNVVQGINRIDWTEGETYYPYTSENVLFDPQNNSNPFYVVTPDYSVYKCISANNGPSLYQPTSRQKSIFTTPDRYLWKYMYTVPTYLYDFITTEFIPIISTINVNNITSSDYGIDAFEITNPGSGYAANQTITIVGDGINCTANAVISGGSITSISITNRGSGYRSATATVPAPPPGVGNTQATIRPIIAPPGGHASNLKNELGAHYVIIVASFNNTEGGLFSVANDFRTVGIIENPISASTGAAITASTISQTTNLKFTAVTDSFVVDELVTGQTSGATGYVVEYDTNKLYLTQVIGNFYPGETVEGATSNATGTLSTASAYTTGDVVSSSIDTVTLPAGTGASFTLPDVDGFSLIIRMESGTANGQIRVINSFTSDTANLTDHWDLGTTPTAGDTYSLGWVKYPEIGENSGNILFIENRRPITRAASQSEDIKCVVEL